MWPEELSEFFDSVADIPNKNRGGCLFFCYVFWLWLIDNDMPLDSFDIIQYDYTHRPKLGQNMEWLCNGNLSPTSSYHFTWIYNGIEYDADGELCCFDDDGLECEALCIENDQIKDFCQHAINFAPWNDEFDREEAIYIIKDRLGLSLDDIEPEVIFGCY